MFKDSMTTTAKQRKKKDPTTHVLTKELVISVTKMKVTELNKWTPVLRSEQTPTLCFEGYVSRINGQKRRYTAYKTQPLDVRLGSYLFRQTNGETCSLVGELYDPSNNLPLSVKSKFKNGIPKKWQTIAKFWDNMQKHSFYRKQLRSFSSRFAWVESLKSSGLLRVSSRGRIIIPSPKYLKGKNVERKEVEAAHLINSQLQLISKNLANSKVVKTLLDTSEGSGNSRPGIDGRQSTGDAEELPSKRQEERNLGPVPAADQNLFERKGSLRKASEDISRKDRFSGKCVSSPLNNSKSSHLRLVSNERQSENRRSAVRSQLNEKQLRKVPVKSRKKSISTSKSSPAVASPMKMAAEALEETKEAAATQGKMLNNTSKRKICKNENKQPRISDLQSSDKTEPGVASPMKMAAEALEETKEAAATQGKLLNNTSKRKICKNDNKQPRISGLPSSDKTEPDVPSKDALETSSRKTEKSEKNKPNLSLDDIDDILTTGAPRTLKQRKKLRKTIDSYAKSQTTCTDLFADPDYNHLIGENDACSSQEWDKDYAEAIERLVNGKLSDQISLGSTSPAQYLQDFVCDDNQSVRSTSPFERTPCDEEFKLRYEHRVLKERNECSRRKSLNMDFLSSFSHRETDASTEADAAYNALIQGKPVPQKLFDLKSNKNNTSSDDSSSECSDEI
ncbi:uncharacterized protein LOC126365754 isoform X4 [Schistocerca gregaria]|uniref:uncharacterized protein LOC126365754 isoform X4 n=1 Tax=Schistocerca gregaria TaxID=7010 RepID=UPI00211E81E8|nr:uncharacterized protein LOC126365754 isoform X4 [Schistocerca gregaria]XP_049864196.1 uncharacterized protein LOC126365754 isoform X4 [Schistocerca gregaria]